MLWFIKKGPAMAEPMPEDVTLKTLHGDLKGGFADLKQGIQTGFTDLKGEVRGGFTDLKAALIAGFRNMPTREDSQEMIRLHREANRIQDERLTQLDLRIREQHLENQQVLRGIADGIRALLDGQHLLLDGQRTLHEVLRALAEGQRALHEDIRALIARLDALIKGRGDGGSSS